MPCVQRGVQGGQRRADRQFLEQDPAHRAEPERGRLGAVARCGAVLHIAADGTVQIDKSKCIGCQFCAMACPYGVRYLNEDEGVVEKCTLCEQKIAQGELPQCVSQCCGMARWFGDAEGDVREFRGPRGETAGEFLEEFSDEQVHKLPDVGNKPSFAYILRDMKWQGGE